jgi:hypothetical protein
VPAFSSGVDRITETLEETTEMPSMAPRWSRRLLPKQREILLSASIEYSQSAFRDSSQYEDQMGMHLSEKGEKLENIHPQMLEKEVTRVIQDRLPGDLMELFGIDAQIKVQGVRFGSLLVVFSVLLSGYSLLASYKDFHDSIQLIKEHCKLLLSKLLRDLYPHRSFSVSVDTRYPTLPDPFELSSPLRFWERRGIHPAKLPWDLWGSAPLREHPRRDGFFWFLLGLCVLLLVALSVLVYAAVVQTYFS